MKAAIVAHNGIAINRRRPTDTLRCFSILEPAISAGQGKVVASADHVGVHLGVHFDFAKV